MERWIRPFPLERGRVENAVQRPVIDGVETDSVRFYVKRQTIQVPVRMAASAGELSTERDRSVVKQAFTATNVRHFGGTAKIDGSFETEVGCAEYGH
jgi:hypothetical protein